MLKRLAISVFAASLLGAAAGGPLLAQDAEQETGQEPVVLGGRIEVPAAGYALTVPEDWVALYPSAEDAAAITDALRSIDPELATTLEAALTSGVGFSFLAFGGTDETGFRDNCNVIDYPTEGASLGMAVAADIAAMGDMGEALVGEPVTESIDLPAGESARVEYALEYPGVQAVFSAYYFTDGTVFHLLTCTGTERPDDSWLSIAESFEFLAAGEPPLPGAVVTPEP
jgi:hypothetical protein